MGLSIVIPVYNEQECLEKCINSMENVFSDSEFEIIYVNDGSMDNTHKILNENKTLGYKLIEYQKNKGYASAIKEGIKKSTKEYISFFDADMQVTPKTIFEMYEYAKENELKFVSGKANTKGYGFFRGIVSKGYNFLVNLFFKVGLSDINSPKIIKRDLVDIQNLNYDDAMIDLEIILDVIGKGVQVNEYDFSYQDRIDGESKFNILLIPKTFISLIRLRFKR